MKKTFLILVLAFLATTSFCQTQDSSPLTRDYYLEKSKKQKTAAWVMLAGGAAMATVGLVAFSQDFTYSWDNPSSSSGEGGAVLGSAGFLVMLGSIPLFIASGRNARKAAAVSLNTEHVPFLVRNAFALKKQLALTLRVPL